MAVLGLRFCVRAFSSCGKQGPLFIVVRRPLTIAASLVAEHRLQMRRLSNCGSRAQLLRGMWDLPRPDLEPVSPALAGRFSTTAPPGKSPGLLDFSMINQIYSLYTFKEHRKLKIRKKNTQRSPTQIQLLLIFCLFPSSHILVPFKNCGKIYIT